MELGDADGHGRYGMLDETSDGLVCHECGRAFPNLGLHAWRGHGMQRGCRRSHYEDELRRRLCSLSAVLVTRPRATHARFPMSPRFVP